MFNLIVYLSRFMFTALIAFFLYEGVVYILIERKKIHGDIAVPIMLQRITIIFFHVTAFLIVILNPKNAGINTGAILVAAGSLVFFLFAFFVTKKLNRRSCPLMFNGVIFLLDIGYLLLQRLGPEVAQKQIAQRQLIFSFAGFVAMLFIPLILRIIKKAERLSFVYLIGAGALLSSVFIFGEEQYGAVNWIQIMGIGFQPSEFAKILFVMYFAASFSKNFGIKKIALNCVIAAGLILILVIAKDLGGALIFFMTYMTIIFAATGSYTLFFSGLGAFGAASAAAYNIDKFAHIRVRIVSWLNPWKYISNEGYQITQAHFAMFTWGAFGSGLTKGYSSIIPFVEKDFIFAAVTEEFGFIFAFLIIGVYIMIFYRGINVALRSRNRFHSLVSVGFTSILAIQTFIIIGGNIKLIPLTGVTLPFVSYGGSSVFVSIIIIGLLQWVYSADAKLEVEAEDYAE